MRPLGLAGPVMALDLGSRRIGVAVSDALHLTARPLCTLPCRSRRADVERIAQLVVDVEASLVVVGWPLLPSGDPGERAHAAEAFAAALERRICLPVVLWDESCTTEAAQERRRERGRSRRRASVAGLDAEAAAVLLEEWLAAAGETEPQLDDGH